MGLRPPSPLLIDTMTIAIFTISNTADRLLTVLDIISFQSPNRTRFVGFQAGLDPILKLDLIPFFSLFARDIHSLPSAAFDHSNLQDAPFESRYILQFI